MLESNYLLKNKIGDIGFYCEITIQVIELKDNNLQIDYSEFSEWKHAIYLGCKYFLDKYRSANKVGLFVRIMKLNTYIIDTTDMVVFHTVVRCLEKAFDFRIAGFVINDKGYFVIPK